MKQLEKISYIVGLVVVGASIFFHSISLQKDVEVLIKEQEAIKQNINNNQRKIIDIVSNYKVNASKIDASKELIIYLQNRLDITSILVSNNKKTNSKQEESSNMFDKNIEELSNMFDNNIEESSNLFANDIEVLKISLGAMTGTYMQIGKDMAKIASDYGVMIKPISTHGSVDNIRLMVKEGATPLAIVQSDVLSYFKKSHVSKFSNYGKSIRKVFPLYNEEVHLFARKEIKNLQNLMGKRVVIGFKSSGTNLTAQNILQIAGIKPATLIEVSIDDGIKMVLLGEADAVFTVSGKPRKGFLNLFNTPKKSVLKLLKKVHFVPLDNGLLLQEYDKAFLSNQDYPFLNETIPTVSVKALLISFNFSSKKSVVYRKRCSQVYKFAQIIRKNIGKLRGKDFHPKWKEVVLKDAMVNSLIPVDECTGY